MTVWIGHISLIFALITSLSASILGIKPHQKTFAKIQVWGVFSSLSLALTTLLFAYVTSDFSILNVYMNSHTAKPLLYKIAGVWGNHEGSMILLVWLMALWTALFTLYYDLSKERIANIISIQMILLAGLLGYIVITSNPFIAMPHIPENGLGLNPLLQDMGLAIHPPMLYTGYVGFSLPFSTAIVILLEGKCDREWAKMTQTCALIAWGFLTLGIGLGSSWAYRELGWGGFWFWDPVENASLVPWLVATALIHSITVSVKKEGFYAWTVLLAILTFLFCLLGTLIVRSGMITSVHNFAQDPERGLFILALLSIVATSSLFLYGLRAPKISRSIQFHPFSKEMMLLINNLLMICACATVLIGTLYPLFHEWWAGEKLSVGMPYYVSTFIPMFSPLILLAAIGPLITWYQDNWKRHAYLIGGITIIVCVVILLMNLTETYHLRFFFGMVFALSLIISMIWHFLHRIYIKNAPWSTILKNITQLSPSYLGMTMAHIGVGIVTFSLTALDAWTIDELAQLKQGESFSTGPYHIILRQISFDEGPNYYLKKAQITVTKHGHEVALLYPEIRLYPTENMVTTEAALSITPCYDLYTTIGDHADQKTLTVRFYVKPFMVWVWIGGVLMVFGGFLACQKRYILRYKNHTKGMLEQPVAS